MSQYGLIYRMEWDTTDVVRSLVAINVPSKTIRVNIYDTENLIDDADTPVVKTLTPAAPALTMSVINNDEDKFSPVRAKQAVIRFLTNATEGLNMDIFADASDNRFKVEIIADGIIMFLGFLMLPDIQQPFLPDPQVCELTATDHLGALKDIPLADDDGLNLTGKFKLSQFLAYALKKTGLELDIKVVNNIRHGSGSITIPASFVTDGDLIFVDNAYYNFFYPGQQLTITNTAGNNINVRVFSVTAIFFTIISVYENLTDEPVVNATFTDRSGGHLYDSIYLDALTFETNIGESEDCRTVIEKILGEDCFLTQYKGAWWIMRIKEINDSVMYLFTFDPDGVIDNDFEEITPTRNVGNTASICHADANTIMRYDRPNKFIKEVYRYVAPKEIFCNIDMGQGDEITPPNLALAESTGTYELDCWTLRRISGSITSTVYVLRRYEYGYAKDKYAVITPKTGTATPWDFIESQPVEVRAKDKGSVSVDWRFETNFSGGGSTYFPMKIYLHGDDGNWYYWWHPSSTDITQFYWTNAGTSEVERLIPDIFDVGAVNESEWRSLSVKLGPIPVDGKLYFGLIQGHQGNAAGDNQNINFQGFSFDYIPFINGSYQLYTGQHNKVTRLDGGINHSAIREREVYMSDSPRKNFKGAMIFLSDGVYYLTTRFYESSLVAITGSPALTGFNQFGYFQAFAVWNQYKNANRIFPSSLYGLFATAGTEWPDIVNKYSLTDTNPNTNDRRFILVSMTQNWKEAKWTGTFIECFNTQVGYVETDTHEFKYLTQ